MEAVISICLGLWLTGAGYLAYRQLRREYAENAGGKSDTHTE